MQPQKVYGPTILCLWQNFTHLVPLIAKIPQNCSNQCTTPYSLHLKQQVFEHSRFVHLSVTKATWCRIWTIHNKYLGVCIHFQVWVTFSALLRQSQPGHSPSHLQTLHRYSSPSTFIQSVDMSTTRWLSATPQC